MSVRNQNWYNLQATRRYPLDDTSTGEDNNSGNIRDNILVDCHIRTPRKYGEYLYVQGINISDTLISVVIGVAHTLTAEENTTVGVVSVLKPQAEFVNIAITPLQPGVAGWLAFGSGIREAFSGRYATAAQTLIAARCGRAYNELPIQTLGKYNLATALSGIVNITAAAPVTATYHDAYVVPKYNPETGETNSKAVKAIVFSGQAPTADFNPYSYFLGPCSQRPETGTCHKKPLETINGVSADCETGNINVVVGGGFSSHLFKNCGGLDITTPLGLAASCNEKPPGQEKRKDICCPNEDGESEYCWPEETQTQTAQFQVLAQTQNLPIVVDLKPAEENDYAAFTTRAGEFEEKAAGYAALNPAGINLSTYNQTASDWALNTTVAVNLSFLPGTDAVAGVLLNFSVNAVNSAAQTTYTAAVINAAENKLQIVSHNGRALVVEQEAILTNTAALYYVAVSAAPATTGATLTAEVKDAISGAPLSTLTTTVGAYEVVNGKHGLISLRRGAVFEEFSIK